MLARHALVCLVLLAAPGSVAAASWLLSPETTVGVDVSWQGARIEVRFPSVSGEIVFDERDPDAAEARITVLAGDAETGLALVDALVRSRDYLAADQYPAIVFVLDRLVRTSATTAEISGRITLRGVTRPVTFVADVFRYAPAVDDPGRFEAGFDLRGTIVRTEFGSFGGLPDVPAVLPVRIHLLMTSR